MSFDIFLFTSNLSDEKEEEVNPFTGEKVMVAAGETVTPYERRAILELLQSNTATGCDEKGYYDVRLADGSFADFFFSGLEGNEDFSSGMIAVRGLSDELVRFIYEVAGAGNMVIIPVTEPPLTVATSQAVAKRVMSRWPDVVVAESPRELSALLSGGYSAWLEFRNQCLGAD